MQSAAPELAQSFVSSTLFARLTSIAYSSSEVLCVRLPGKPRFTEPLETRGKRRGQKGTCFLGSALYRTICPSVLPHWALKRSNHHLPAGPRTAFREAVVPVSAAYGRTTPSGDSPRPIFSCAKWPSSLSSTSRSSLWLTLVQAESEERRSENALGRPGPWPLAYAGDTGGKGRGALGGGEAMGILFLLLILGKGGCFLELANADESGLDRGVTKTGVVGELECDMGARPFEARGVEGLNVGNSAVCTCGLRGPWRRMGARSVANLRR